MKRIVPEEPLGDFEGVQSGQGKLINEPRLRSVCDVIQNTKRLEGEQRFHWPYTPGTWSGQGEVAMDEVSGMV